MEQDLKTIEPAVGQIWKFYKSELWNAETFEVIKAISHGFEVKTNTNRTLTFGPYLKGVGTLIEIAPKISLVKEDSKPISFNRFTYLDD